MPSWNDLHYGRAQEFARLIGDLAIGNAPPVAAPASSPPPAPAPVAPAAPAKVPPPSPAPATPPAASPTAGSLFNKMPWKK